MSKIQQHLDNAIVLLREEKEDEAIQVLTEVLAVEPSCAEAMLLRADAKKELRQFQDALKDYEEAIRLGGDLGRATLGFGICLCKRQLFSDALNRLEHAVAALPDNGEAFYWRGRAYYELKKYKEAISDLNKAIELEVIYPEALAFRNLAESNLLRVMTPQATQTIPTDKPEESDYYTDSHPIAKEILRDGFLWSIDEYSPIGGDTAMDAMEEFWGWRRRNPNASLKTYISRLFAEWGYSSSEINAVKNGKPSAALGDLHLVASVYDDVVIAISFGQFMMDGYLHKDLRTLATSSIKRQMNPQVIEFRVGNDDLYVGCLNKIQDAISRMPSKPPS